MIYGQRYTRNRLRCRAITADNRQCPRASKTFICGVAICAQHKNAMKPGVPFHYVQLQPDKHNG